MIDRTEKLEIPLKFAKRAALYNNLAVSPFVVALFPVIGYFKSQNTGNCNFLETAGGIQSARAE